MTELGEVIVSATVIVISKDCKALIVQRLPDGAYPNLWTVAGGKMQNTDGIPHSEGLRSYALESCARRELYEETGILLGEERLQYLDSITALWDQKTKRVIVSFYVWLGQNSEDIKIRLNECQDYRWINRNEITKYNFIPDIGGEIDYAFVIRAREIERIMGS